jgi:tRNA nucleotidyltransferase (CCA-adding enzyme)
VSSLSRKAIPDGALRVADVLHQAGHGAWIVGGCVRDLLRGVEVSDWDVATSAVPAEVQRLFRRTVPTGIKHGTITVLDGRDAYEVTTLRGEGAYTDGRRPDRVEFVTAIEDDLGRRDFTVNAIAFDPVSEVIVDPWGGVPDLAARILRAVRDPMERFAEDGLRVLRAARFVATLEMALDPATEAAIRPNLAVLAKVSRERVLAEWEKALDKAAQPSAAFDVMRRTGMLEVIAPLLAQLDEPAFTRGLRRMDRLPRGLVPRLTGLCLEVADVRALDAMLADLRASNDDRSAIVHLVRTFHHGPLAGADATTLRTWLREVGRSQLKRAQILRDVDAAARELPGDGPALAARIDAELATGLPLAPTELAVKGQDLLTELGLTPGRHVGELLDGLYHHTLLHPEANERDALLALARAEPDALMASARARRQRPAQDKGRSF